MIVSATEKSGMQLAQLMAKHDPHLQAVTTKEAAAARRALAENEFEFVLVNTPLADEFGTDLASHAAQTSQAGILLLVKEEQIDAALHRVEQDGVAVVGKPLNRDFFFQTLRLLHSTHQQLQVLHAENKKLRRRLDEERLISRAKCILIECMAMTEPEAHNYLERQAMNQRVTRYEVAVQVVQTNG